MRVWKTYQDPVIEHMLRECCKAKTLFTVWQVVGGVRGQWKAFLEIQGDKLSFLFDADPAQASPRIGEVTYFYHPYRELAFKKDRVEIQNGRIMVPFPHELTLKEERLKERLPFKYPDHKEISFASFAKTDMEKKTVPLFRLSAVLVDLSISGAGLVLSSEFSEKLKVGETVVVEKVTDQNIPGTFLAKICHLSQYQRENIEHTLKVGLQFHDILDSVVHETLQSVVKRKQSKVKGLDTHLFNGLDEQTQQRKLKEIALKNNVLSARISENIEQIDRLRYLTQQMKGNFLARAQLGVLAIALRLSDKELIYDLLHDVSERLRDEILDKMTGEISAAAIEKAQGEIMKFIRQQELAGEIVLDPTMYVTYV